MSEKYVYFQLTPMATQQLILAELMRLRLNRDSLQRSIDLNGENVYSELSETMAVHESLCEDLASVEAEIEYHEKRHYKLMGFYSDGIPF